MLKPFASLLTNVLFLIVLTGFLTWIVQTVSFLDTSASGWPMSIYRQRGAIPMPVLPHQAHPRDFDST